MNPLGPDATLAVLSDLFWLVAVITVAFAAVGISVVAALTVAEWKAALRESRPPRRPRPHPRPAASPAVVAIHS